jgi:hypothetical protein
MTLQYRYLVQLSHASIVPVGVVAVVVLTPT